MKVVPEAGRVAMFLGSEIGGLASKRLHLAEALLSRGYDVDLVLPRLRRGLTRVPRGARAIELTPWLPPRRTVVPGHYAAVAGLARYLRRERPHVLLSSGTPRNLAAISAKWLSRTNVRLVCSQHAPLSAEIDDRLYRSGAVMPFMVRNLYPAADAIVAVSWGVAQDLQCNIKLGHKLLVVIYNPVIRDWCYQAMLEQPSHAWLSNKQHLVVVAAGRLVKLKGFDTLLHAFRILCGAGDARLIILGEGPERPALEKRIQELNLENQVDMPGAVENPYAYMARADLFVLSSYFEGFPAVVVEALACGCPVVATDCPGGVAEILERGRYGRMVPAGDAEALAEAMLETVQHRPDPAPLRRRALDFHVDRIVERYQEVLGL